MNYVASFLFALTNLGCFSLLFDYYANQVGADLIVMGSHGKAGIRLLLGSTTQAVLHSAKCDVLAVKVK